MGTTNPSLMRAALRDAFKGIKRGYERDQAIDRLLRSPGVIVQFQSTSDIGALARSLVGPIPGAAPAPAPAPASIEVREDPGLYGMVTRSIRVTPPAPIQALPKLTIDASELELEPPPPAPAPPPPPPVVVTTEPPAPVVYPVPGRELTFSASGDIIPPAPTPPAPIQVVEKAPAPVVVPPRPDPVVVVPTPTPAPAPPVAPPPAPIAPEPVVVTATRPEPTAPPAPPPRIIAPAATLPTPGAPEPEEIEKTTGTPPTVSASLRPEVLERPVTADDQVELEAQDILEDLPPEIGFEDIDQPAPVRQAGIVEWIPTAIAIGSQIPTVRDAAVAIDKRVNAWLGGDPQETISRRAARDAQTGGVVGRSVCSILDLVDPGHCARSLGAMPSGSICRSDDLVSSITRALIRRTPCKALIDLVRGGGY